MIIENVLARVTALEFELDATKNRLAQVEQILTDLRAQATTGVKSTVAEMKSAPASTSAAKSSR